MFEEYRKYLLNIRNNLIQNGVSLDNGKCDSYRDIFRLGYEIDGLLWLYSVLEISKSRYRLSDTILPMGNYYKGHMRELFRKEYLASKKYYPPTRYDLESFRKSNLISKDTCNKVETVVQLVSVENSSSTTKGGVSYSEHGRYVEDFVKPEQDKTDTESYSSHGRYIEDYVEQEQDKMDINIHERSAKNFVKPENDTESYSSHGRYVEDFVQPVKKSSSQDSTYATHGRYVEDFIPVSTVEETSGVNDYTDHGRFVEDYVEEKPDIEDSEYSDHGRYVEDFEESHENVIDRLFAGFDDEDTSEEDTSEDEDLSDAELGYVPDEEDLPDSEFGYVEDPEVSEDEEDLPDSEFGYVEDSDDEEEYPDSEFGYSEDMDEEEDLPDSEFGYTSDSEEDTDESSEEFPSRKVSNDGIESVQKVNGHMNTVAQKKDLSDDLQDFTNGLLTSGKRAIVKSIKKLIK